MIEEREYEMWGNDCIIRTKKILTKFSDKYIVIIMTKYVGWGNWDIGYEEREFDNEKKAIEFYKENY